ncbi:hypothetical protein QE392_002661 [Microbacterium proteolyticum]|nr:hypothetical protein [Microbacterium proteolyticum]
MTHETVGIAVAQFAPVASRTDNLADIAAAARTAATRVALTSSSSPNIRATSSTRSTTLSPRTPKTSTGPSCRPSPPSRAISAS